MADLTEEFNEPYDPTDEFNEESDTSYMNVKPVPTIPRLPENLKRATAIAAQSPKAPTTIPTTRMKIRDVFNKMVIEIYKNQLYNSKMDTIRRALSKFLIDNTPSLQQKNIKDADQYLISNRNNIKFLQILDGIQVEELDRKLMEINTIYDNMLFALKRGGKRKTKKAKKTKKRGKKEKRKSRRY